MSKMRRASFEQFRRISAEYIIAKARFDRKKGKQPSATLPGISNPRVALMAAKDLRAQAGTLSMQHAIDTSQQTESEYYANKILTDWGARLLSFGPTNNYNIPAVSSIPLFTIILQVADTTKVDDKKVAEITSKIARVISGYTLNRPQSIANHLTVELKSGICLNNKIVWSVRIRNLKELETAIINGRVPMNEFKYGSILTAGEIINCLTRHLSI